MNVYKLQVVLKRGHIATIYGSGAGEFATNLRRLRADMATGDIKAWRFIRDGVVIAQSKTHNTSRE